MNNGANRKSATFCLEGLRLLCAGKCGAGWKRELFTCGRWGGQTALAVGDSVAPPFISCGVVWVLRKVQGPDRAASSRSHHLQSGVWVWTVWLCKWFTWASKCVRVCCEAERLPVFLKLSFAHGIPCFPKLAWAWELCHLSRGKCESDVIPFWIGSAWVRAHQDTLSIGVGTSVLPLLWCVIAESQTPTWPLLIHMCLERWREDINSLSKRKDHF